jgi:hypothetical protein
LYEAKPEAARLKLVCKRDVGVRILSLGEIILEHGVDLILLECIRPALESATSVGPPAARTPGERRWSCESGRECGRSRRRTRL